MVIALSAAGASAAGAAHATMTRTLASTIKRANSFFIVLYNLLLFFERWPPKIVILIEALCCFIPVNRDAACALFLEWLKDACFISSVFRPNRLERERTERKITLYARRDSPGAFSRDGFFGIGCCPGIKMGCPYRGYARAENDSLTKQNSDIQFACTY